MSSPFWFVYLLRCSDGSLYTGIARDPEKRLAEHVAGRGSRIVRSKLPAQIVYREAAAGRSPALKREAEIKRWPRAQKLQLVRSFGKKPHRARMSAMPQSSSENGCPWPAGDPQMTAYHDQEWGQPLYDDRKLFEFLILEGMQAGLSWRCVLHKRNNFRKAFAEFDPEKVARFGKPQIERLMKDAGIIRNRLKIEAAISNAQAFLKMTGKHGTFQKYMWSFVDGKPVVNRWKTTQEIPAFTPASNAMSKALKADGFRFVGSTVCYAHMQATGMVNDHLVTCFRHSECNQKRKK